MNKLIFLELKRNSLRSYHVAALISAVSLLALLYLFAAIPRLDPEETGMDMLMSYQGLVGLTNLICMAIFVILSAVISSRYIVEEYAGKRAILLFSYPVSRRNIFSAKIGMVFLYTVIAMFLCGTVIFGIFFTTEAIVPLCTDEMNIKTIIYSFISLFCYSILAGALGVVALWFGFGKNSVTVNIVAAVMISTIMCQIMAITMTSLVGTIVCLIGGGIVAIIVVNNLINKVEEMEV